MKLKLIFSLFFITMFLSFSSFAQSNGDIILRLSSQTNAHAELYNGAGNYPILIKYSDFFGQTPSQVSRICEEDSNPIVRLSSQTNAHLQDPTLSNYATPVCYEGLYCELVNGVCPDGKTKILGLSSQTNAHAEIASLTNYPYSLCCSVTSASQPEHRQMYFQDLPLSFKHNVPTGATIKWSVFSQDGALEFEETESTFSHTFPSSGQRTIKKEITINGQKTETDLAILILPTNPSGILAFVNSPWHNQIVPNIGNTKIVNFSANDSYLISLSGNCPNLQIECLAGNCPAQTKNYPNSCNEKITLTQTPQTFQNLKFSWSFNGANLLPTNNFSTGSFTYGTKSNELNDKLINLIIEYNGQTQSTKRVFTLGQCINNGQKAIKLDANGNFLEIVDTVGPNAQAGACDLGAGGTCCPAGMSCSISSGGIKKCVITEISKCSDYTTQSSCNSDSSNVIENDPLYSPSNCGKTQDGKVIQCACQWESNECKFVKTEINVTSIPDNGIPTSCTLNSCAYSYTVGECTNGFMKIEVNSTKALQHDTSNPSLQPIHNLCGENVCQELNLPPQVPCGRLNFQLDFFGFKQFLISAILIFLIYTIIIFSKNKNLFR